MFPPSTGSSSGAKLKMLIYTKKKVPNETYFQYALVELGMGFGGITYDRVTLDRIL
jgi:hypothetical protein